MRKSDSFHDAAAALVVFRDEYIKLIELGRAVGRTSYSDVRAIGPRSGKEAEFTEQFQIVARAAGRAHKLAGTSIGSVSVKRWGTVETFDPIGSWVTSIEAPSELKPRLVLHSTEAAIGTLEAKASQARRTESSLAGRLARFFGFPTEVRRLIDADHPGVARVAFGATIVGQTLVTAVAGALTIGIVAGIGHLAAAMF